MRRCGENNREEEENKNKENSFEFFYNMWLLKPRKSTTKIS